MILYFLLPLYELETEIAMVRIFTKREEAIVAWRCVTGHVLLPVDVPDNVCKTCEHWWRASGDARPCGSAAGTCNGTDRCFTYWSPKL